MVCPRQIVYSIRQFVLTRHPRPSPARAVIQPEIFNSRLHLAVPLHSVVEPVAHPPLQGVTAEGQLTTRAVRPGE